MSTRSRFAAFTLIELLVVITIIALLIAIMLPALQNSREMAKRSACLSNTRQLTTAINVYAHDRKGMMPYLYTTDPNGPDYDLWKTYIIYTPNFPTPQTWWGLGLLFNLDYHRSRAGMFCPSMRHPEWQQSTPVNPWPARVAYSYRAGTLDGLTADHYDLRVDANHNRAVIADFWTLDETSNPGQGDLMFSHRDGYNVSFGDGHGTYRRTGKPIITGANDTLIMLAWRQVFDAK